LSYNALNDVILLLSGANLELLLKKYGSLLIIVANDLIDDVLPVAVDCTVKKTAIIEWLRSWKVSLSLTRNWLQ